MWSDNEAVHDLLGVEAHTEVIASVINTPQLLPVTIGVYGDWGSGKSTLMSLLHKRLEQEEDILVISFNGWQFEGYDDAKAALMGTIIDALRCDRRVVEKAKDLAANLARRINWFRLMGLAAKKMVTLSLGMTTGAPLDLIGSLSALMDVSKLSEVIQGLQRDEGKAMLKETEQEAQASIREFREDFAKLIAKTNYKAVVVLVDDLDRCLPPTIIETLEAIRLFMFVPNTAFVIGADERIIRHAVTSKFPAVPGLQVDIGREYLDKMIQVPVRLPSLGPAEVEGYMNLLFAQLHLCNESFDKLITCAKDRRLRGELGVVCNYGIVKEILGELPNALEEDLALSEQLAPVLAAGLQGNPRLIKRFLNSLLLRLRMAETRKVPLKKQVLAKLMLLEYFQLVRFRQLAEWQMEQSGVAVQLKVLEEAARTGSKTLAISSDLETWLSDKWVVDWLRREPALGDIDLGPYFHFSREQIVPGGGILRRLSPSAQEVFAQLTSSSEANRKLGAKSSANLSSAEVSAILDLLADRVRRLENNESVVEAMFELVGVRAELLSQLVIVFEQLPPPNIPLSVPPRLYAFVKGTPVEATVIKLLQSWANSSETLLAKVSQQILKKVQKKDVPKKI